VSNRQACVWVGISYIVSCLKDLTEHEVLACSRCDAAKTNTLECVRDCRKRNIQQFSRGVFSLAVSKYLNPFEFLSLDFHDEEKIVCHAFRMQQLWVYLKQMDSCAHDISYVLGKLYSGANRTPSFRVRVELA
jgi:hypothetical protein